MSGISRRVTRSELKKMLRPVNDAQWVEMSIKIVKGEDSKWSCVLFSPDGRPVQIGLNLSQVTYLSPALEGLSDSFLFCTPYQAINRLAQTFGCHPTAIILDSNIDDIVAGRIEMINDDDERFYLQMSAGDCVVFAEMHNLKIFMIEQLITTLSDH